MKKYLLLNLISLAYFSVNAQTTFNYSGISTNSFIAGFAKAGAIGRNNITTNSINFHIGLVGTANNATFGNVGVLGTTSQNTITNNLTNYYAVYGDNYNNNLVAYNSSVTGGFFSAQNYGTNSYSAGVSASSFGNNNSTTTYGDK